MEKETEVERGEDGSISVMFCANPSPSKAIWEWGSIKLETGYEMGRFKAEKINPVSTNHNFIICCINLRLQSSLCRLGAGNVLSPTLN